MTTTGDTALSESDARQIAYEFREKFKNAEAFELAWNRLFELRAAITPSLSRRFLQQEYVKFRAHTAGFSVVREVPRDEFVPVRPLECPLCGEQFEGQYIEHTSEKHKVRAAPAPGNLRAGLEKARATKRQYLDACVEAGWDISGQ